MSEKWVFNFFLLYNNNNNNVIIKKITAWLNLRQSERVVRWKKEKVENFYNKLLAHADDRIPHTWRNTLTKAHSEGLCEKCGRRTIQLENLTTTQNSCAIQLYNWRLKLNRSGNSFEAITLQFSSMERPTFDDENRVFIGNLKNSEGRESL